MHLCQPAEGGEVSKPFVPVPKPESIETSVAVVRSGTGWALRTFKTQGERVISVLTSQPDLRHIIVGRAQELLEEGE